MDMPWAKLVGSNCPRLRKIKGGDRLVPGGCEIYRRRSWEASRGVSDRSLTPIAQTMSLRARPEAIRAIGNDIATVVVVRKVSIVLLGLNFSAEFEYVQ